jgi:hypothetical protein
MIAEVLLAANICLQGGEQVDISQYIPSTTTVIEVKVTFKPARGTLVIYSPGYEDKKVRFTARKPIGWITIAKPILCLKATGGPFDFDIQIWSARVS